MRRRLLALGMAGALAIAACGGDDDGEESAATDAAATVADAGGADTTAAPLGTAAGAGAASADTAADGTTAADATASADTAATGDTAAGGTAATAGSDAPAGTTGGGDAPAAAGGTLRYGDSVGPSRFDPHLSTIGQDIRFFAPVYARLVHFDAEGNLIPGLATDWEFSEDGLTLTMHLREGVTFHDGAEFNAEAVKANIERGQTLEGSSIAGDLSEITAIETPDPATVVFTLSRPNSMLPGLLSHRAGAMVSPTAFENPDLDVMPVGAGPYRVTEHVQGDRIVYERFEDFWDDVAGPDRIELTIIPDSITRLSALRSGQVDLTIINGNQISEAEQAGFSVNSEPALTYLVLYLNRAKAEFDNELVRQAMNHAINRQAIVDAVLLEAGTATVQPFPEGYVAYNPDYPADYYPYDPERARELLEEAGVPDGFTFEMLVTNLDTYVRTGEAIQQMLAEVGITAEIRLVEGAQTADVYYARQEGDALVSQWGGRPDPQMTLELQFTDEGFSNPGRHSTPELMAANELTRETTDPDARGEALRAETAVVVEQALQVPIANDFANFAYSDRIVEFARLITGQPNFPGIVMAED